MQIIPVIDLLQNLVVHAVAGNRKNYKAIDSKICSSANPLDVVDGYLKLYNFKSIYIADLDALEQRGSNVETIKSICNKYPSLEIWLDCGASCVEYYLHQELQHNLRLILSSESIRSISVFTNLLDQYPEHRFILSLDFKADIFLGTDDLFDFKEHWPNDVIVLNLNNVGVTQGVSYPAKLKTQELTKNFNIYYGGGVRNTDDIKNLDSMGFTGTLISTAIHKKILTSEEIHTFNQ